jgi:TfuA protein
VSKPVIFLGPSLPWSHACTLLDADYRPPVKRGDVYLAAREKPPLIGIIDGVFLTTLPPSPLEVLEALRAGVPIMGSSSLGALRATELESHGMIGVGSIFQMYRRRQLIADDEVALIFSPEDYRPLSEPMVNIRHALSSALRAGIIDKRQRQVLVRIGKSFYFPERSWPHLFQAAAADFSTETLEALKEFISTGDFDLKKQDAIHLLRVATDFLNQCTQQAGG